MVAVTKCEEQRKFFQLVMGNLFTKVLGNKYWSLLHHFTTLGHPFLAKLGPGGTDSPCFGMGQDCLWDSEEQQC